MKTVLLFGGRGAEHAVSVRSAAFVLSRLSSLGHEVFPLGVDRKGALYRCPASPSALTEAWETTARPVTLLFEEGNLLLRDAENSFFPDLVFSVMHGKDGEDGAWQGLFTLARLPFVGANVTASALGMNKRLSKLLAEESGVPIVPFLTAKRVTTSLAARVSHRLTYPLFVKPTSGGSSVGVSRVSSEEALPSAVSLALEEDEEALIEEAIEGTELAVGVLERDGALLLSPPAEIRTDVGFYDYDAKYRTHTASIRVPAPLSSWETAYAKQLAATVFRALGCRDMARVDLLRRKDGKIFFNEINTLPGFTSDSLFPRLFSEIGVDAIAFLTEGRT